MRYLINLIVGIVFLVVTFSVQAQGDLSARLKGQASSTKLNVGTIEIPGNLATKTGSISALIETGNNNILSNPGFEHSTYSSGWTLGGTATYSAETSVVIQGKKSLKAVTSSQEIELTQDSTIYESQFADSVQCEASVKVKSSSTVAPVICARTGGTTSTVDCITAANDSKWGTYTIPFICKSTSNGISIVTGVSTGTTYIDDVYVGVAKNLASSAEVGPWKTGTCTSTWTSNTTTSCRYRINGDSIDVQYHAATSGAPTSATLYFSLPSGFTVNTSKVTNFYQIGTSRSDDNSTSYIGTAYLDSANGRIYPAPGRDAVNTGTSYIQQTHVTQAIPFTFGASDAVFVEALGIPVNELNGNVTTYSQPCGINCENVFSAQVSSAGVVSTENVDWINGDFSKASSRYTASLISGFSAGMSCTCTGRLANGDINCTATASSSQVIVDMETDGVATDNAFQVMCQKQSSDYQASRSIVGSFKDNVVSPGAGQISIYASRLTCSSSSSIDNAGPGNSWITSIGNISSGICTVTLTSGKFSAIPYCWMQRGNSTNDQDTWVVTTSATSIDVGCKNQAGTGCTTFSPRLFCLGLP